MTHPAHTAGVEAFRRVEEDALEGGCGCEDDYVREVLTAAAPLLEAEARRELLAELEAAGRLRDTPGEISSA